MNAAALQQLDEAQCALGAALDRGDVEAIHAAADAMAVAVENVRRAGGWTGRPGLRDHVLQILTTAEVARGRVNALADHNRRKLDKLVNLVGAPRAVAYGRTGKLAL